MALPIRRYHGFVNFSKFSTGKGKLGYGKKPRHTPETRREATRRERLRVKALSQAYESLQQVIPFDSDTKITYLSILRGAVAYIKALEMILGVREDIIMTKNKKKGKATTAEKENHQDVITVKEEVL